MPPAVHTEEPALRDQRVRKHLRQSREYWLKCPTYLAEGDLCQAGEKGWGAFAQITKAVASHRGWRHFSHMEVLTAARQVADESDDTIVIRESIEIARTMHTNFFEVDLDRIAVERGLARVETLLQTFWLLLPERYTGGLSLNDWLAAGDPLA